MRKILMSGLVLGITIITLAAIFTFRSNRDIKTTEVYQGGESNESYSSDDTGYIFDDYGKNINIPLDKSADVKQQNDSSK